MIDYIKKYIPIVFIVTVGLILYVLLQDHHIDENEQLIDHELFQLEEINVQNNKQKSDSTENNEASEVVVDIKGAVHRPGVYEVNTNSRVHHVIELAGGFTNDADEKQINLAEKVDDEMVIYVPVEGEENLPIMEQVETSSRQSNMIRVNVATVDELTELNGIGPAKAEAIIEYREENGPFNQVEDLLQVNGIGEKTLENIREHIIIP